MEHAIALTEVVEQLRGDLTKLVENAEGKGLTFTVEGIELELKCAVSTDVAGRGGVKLWVVEFGASEAHKTEFVQTVKLKLKPNAPSGGDVRVSASGGAVVPAGGE